jgi:hypothetical protein
VKSTTLAELRNKVRLLADERVSGYLTDDAVTGSGLDPLINLNVTLARAQLFAEPQASNYFRCREDVAAVAGQSDYELGSGVSSLLSNAASQLHQVIARWATTRHEFIEVVNEQLETELVAYTWGEYVPKGMLVYHNDDGMYIRLIPTPNAATNLTVIYTPEQAALVESSDTLLGPEGMAEMVECMTAKVVLGMQGKPSDHIDAMLVFATDTARKVIRDAVPEYTKKVLDVRPEGVRRFRPWRNLPPA